MARDRAHTIWAGLSQATYDSIMEGKGVRARARDLALLSNPGFLFNLSIFYLGLFVCLFYFLSQPTNASHGSQKNNRPCILEGRLVTNPILSALHCEGPKCNIYMYVCSLPLSK